MFSVLCTFVYGVRTVYVSNTPHCQVHSSVFCYTHIFMVVVLLFPHGKFNAGFRFVLLKCFIRSVLSQVLHTHECQELN